MRNIILGGLIFILTATFAIADPITLVDRRDYWVSQNNEPVSLRYRGGSIIVAPNQLVTQGELMSIPITTIEDWLVNRDYDRQMGVLDTQMNAEIVECIGRLSLGESISQLRMEFKGDINTPLDLETWIIVRKTLRAQQP